MIAKRWCCKNRPRLCKKMGIGIINTSAIVQFTLDTIQER